MLNEQEILKIVVVGHVDHGKSTVIGRLLHDTQSVPEGKIERIKQICKEKGKPFEYAYLLDAFEEEQKQGITIDITQLQFFTEQRGYVIIDAPGHKEFLKNMISGAANAEAALLIIDAQEGVQEQTRRHGYILSLLGIRKVYVVVNKMDMIEYSEDKFEQILSEMSKFLNNLDVYPLKYIPVAALYGENITTSSSKMPWYLGEPLLSALDRFDKDKGLEEKPLRFPIQDVYKFDNRRIVAGRIEAGTLKVGDEILISPSNKLTRVKTIEHWAVRDKRDAASAGMSVGITLEDEFFNQRGELITHPDQPPLASNLFKANLFWMGKTPLVKGKIYKLKLATQEQGCEIISINKVIDATTLDICDYATKVNTNDIAELTFKTREKICFDEFRNSANTGRFVLVDGYDVSGGGIVSGVVEDAQPMISLADGQLTIVVSCFDDYLFVINAGELRRVAARPHRFKPGDALPLKGDSYHYPEDIDLIDWQAQLVARIRKSRLEELLVLDNYVYAALPIIDRNGASMIINGQEDWDNLIKEFAACRSNNNHLAAANNQWMDFMKYRHIKFADSLKAVDADYYI